jgi:hypothetical protein
MARMITRPSLIAVPAALAAIALVAAGCGSSSGASTTTQATPSAPAATAAAPGSSAVNPNAPEVSPSGDIPDNQAFVEYAPAGAGYAIKVPEGWARTDKGGGTVSWTDKLNSIQVESHPAATAPTPQSVQADVGPTLAKLPGYKAGQASTVDRTAGKAVLVTYSADSSPDPVTGKVVHDAVERYSFWKNGKQVDVTLSGPTGADNVDPWKIVTDSLRWTP